MGPFGGWDMPIQYEGILTEHEHTRKKASLFDICHMGEFELKGPTAGADLERLLTQNVSKLAVGQCRYGYLLRNDGGVLDDLTVYHRGTDHYWLVVNAGTCARDAEWIKSHLSPTTQFTDLSPAIGKLDIQGPVTRQKTEKVFGKKMPDLKYFRFEEVDLLGEPCLLSRTGYTGEWGYEIYMPWDATARFWAAFLADPDIQPAGLGARDTLRLEMGYPLYGHELSENQTPVPAGRGSFIDLTKDFIGKSAVERDIRQGSGKWVVGLQLQTRQAARAGDKVFHKEKHVGEITSGSLAPSLNIAVAMALVDEACGQPGSMLEVDIRGKHLPAFVVELPFYKHGTARM